MSRIDLTVAAFVHCARPILAGIVPRNSCISQARITLECMRRLGVRAEPIVTSLQLEAPAIKLMYLSGFTPQERQQMRERCETEDGVWTEPYDSEPGWRGHVCTLVGGRKLSDARWFVDTTLDQASSPDKGLEISPGIISVPLWRKRPEFATGKPNLELTLWADCGENVYVRYFPKTDNAFLTSEAWGLPHIEPVIRFIVDKMRAALQEPGSLDREGCNAGDTRR